jgi:hypothetical protein
LDDWQRRRRGAFRDESRDPRRLLRVWGGFAVADFTKRRGFEIEMG